MLKGVSENCLKTVFQAAQKQLLMDQIAIGLIMSDLSHDSLEPTRSNRITLLTKPIYFFLV
jgi:hypothetical protein